MYSPDNAINIVDNAINHSLRAHTTGFKFRPYVGQRG